jgi:hypothetical protein
VAESEAEIRAQLEALRTAPNYQTLRPIVEAFQSVLNIGQVEIARAGLQVVRAFQQSDGAAAPTKSALERAAIGILNEGPMNADTIVNVGGDATFKDAVFKIALQGIKEMPGEPSVEVAFVLLAMTKQQADELASGHAFQQQPEILQQNFATLAAHLPDKWSDHYGASPEQWRPRGERSIAELIGATLDELNESGEFKKLVPKFHDIKALGDGTRVSRNLVRHLRRNGCLVIADAISLRHPALLRAYQRCLLDVFPSTSVLTLTPGVDALGLMQGMVYALQLNLQDSEFKLRFDDLVENRACQVESQLDDVPHWLVGQVKRIYDVARGEDRPKMFAR